MKRHPKLSILQPGSLPVNRATGCSKEVMDTWFQDFETFLKSNNLVDKADRIWNADESGFPLQHKSGKVMAPRGAKTVYALTSSSKQQITTLACINAAGSAIPPMHIFPGERFRSNPLEGAIPRTVTLWVDGLGTV